VRQAQRHAVRVKAFNLQVQALYPRGEQIAQGLLQGVEGHGVHEDSLNKPAARGARHLQGPQELGLPCLYTEHTPKEDAWMQAKSIKLSSAS
jgi:hypothetical protein